MSTVSMTPTEALGPLVYGTRWDPAATGSELLLHYSFPGAASLWDYATAYGTPGEPNQGFAALASLSEQQAVRGVLGQWAAVAGIEFAEVADNALSSGALRFSYTGWQMNANRIAYTYLPNPSASAGDVWLNETLRNSKLASFEPGSLGWYTLLHETGHALGLKHPDSASPYSSATLSTMQDSLFNSIMSSKVWPGIAATASGNIDRYPTTPMSLDIDALQALYGPDTTAADDDRYVFASDGEYFQTLFDSGGTDTVELTGARSSRIDLRPGAWSQIGLPILINSGQIQSAETVQIYHGSLIENAVGAAGADWLTGNDLANALQGGAGNDTLAGGGGDDILQGDAGADVFVLDGASLDQIVDFNPAQGDRVDLAPVLGLIGTLPQGSNPFSTGHLALLQDGGNALLLLDADGSAQPGTGRVIARLAGTSAASLSDTSFVQNFQPQQPSESLVGLTIIGTAGEDALTGTADDDTINGLAGNDVLRGEAGNDQLQGGAGSDQLIGGNGADIAVYTTPSTEYLVETRGPTTYVTHIPTGDVDRLTQIESLRFSNTTQSLPQSSGVTLVGTSGPDNLGGTQFDDEIYGSGGDDVLLGLGGNDFLDGGTGADRMEGAEGGDTYTVDSLLDVIIEILEQDPKDPNYPSDLLLADVPGADLLQGALEPDRFSVQPEPLDVGAVVDKVIASVNYTLGAFVEDLQLAAAAGNLSGNGNELANTITGNASNNVLNGLAGNDVLLGAAGDDIIDGGTGSDTAVFAGALSAYTVSYSSAQGVYTVSSALEGTDTIRNVEFFQFANTTVPPNTLVDTAGPFVQSFSPVDEAGNVALSANVVLTFNEAVMRGTGSIVLRTSFNSTVVESFDAATSANLSFSGNQLVVNPSALLAPGTGYLLELPAGSVLDLSGNPFAGSANYNFTTTSAALNTVNGSAGADNLAGTAGDDAINGLGGNDTLSGLGGDNLLDGGTGIDTAVFSGTRAQHTLTRLGDGTSTVQKPNAQGVDTLSGVERLAFTGSKLAIASGSPAGLDANARDAALLLGAAVGKAALANQPLVGTAISLFDQGFTLGQLSDALVANGIMASLGAGPGNAAFVSAVVTNALGGITPGAATLASLQSLIDTNQLTQGQFLAVIAAHPLNQANVDLVGLTNSGLEFS